MDMSKDAQPTSANSDYKGGIIYWQTKAILFVLAVLCCAVASDSFAGSRDNVLATLQLADGTLANFTETRPGEIVVLVQAPADIVRSTGAINGVRIEAFEDLDAVGQYQALSGLDAPAALVQAQARVTRAQSANVAVEDRVAERVKEPRYATLRQPASNAGWFRDNFCPNSGYTFIFCWLDRTGNGWVQDNASFFRSVLYAESGNVGHNVQHLENGQWYTDLSWTVLQGWWDMLTVTGDYRGRRTDFYEGEGDLWHAAIYGS